MKIEQKKPSELKMHALVRAMDDGDEDSPAQLALADSVNAVGVREPLLNSARNEILNGKRR